MRCPRCGSNNGQIISETRTKGKDFSVGSGLLGYWCLGPIGILCGACGGGKKIRTVNYWFCRDCGKKCKV
ncbi:MAG TPA: hypothetical protein DCX21_02760 [Eubacterium sp.]|nr:hypothetical protein [Lachnospiraceae bacterium]HAZ90873.1 hypothetical protein [Eubacterium sp.]HBZ53472.1 hypothetical protein [Eubacterium sp.]